MAIGPDFVVTVSTASFLLCSMQLMCLICDWRSNDVRRLPEACSHTLMVPSRDYGTPIGTIIGNGISSTGRLGRRSAGVTKNWSLEVRNMHMTAWVWPVYVCRQVPVPVFQAFSWFLAQCAPANIRRLSLVRATHLTLSA